MLNLNRYRDREAYYRYAAVAATVLERVGGKVLWHAQAQGTVIGDQTDVYDEVIAVWYPSAAAFIALTADPELLSVREDRAAGLERAALDPLRGLPRAEPRRTLSPVAGAYWPQPWTCEDGGSRRWGSAPGQPGLGIAAGERLEVAAVRQAFATDALVRREPGELYALRHGMPLRGPQSTPVEAWVERLDPADLGVTAATPRLPGGAYWPGGIAAHACGDLHLVFGRWAHRLSPDLEVLASHRLPVPRPHNSFVVLDGGELVTKDCDAPAGREPSTVSVLDPLTLLPVAEPLRLGEPVVARLSSDGESVIAVGATVIFRLRLDRAAERIEVDDRWAPRYGPAADRGYGWDPVITDAARLLDGQRAKSHRPHDARQRRGVQPGAPLVGAPRRRVDAVGRDQRPSVRD